MTVSTADRRRTDPGTLAWLAGPCLLLAGLLILVSQFAVWPLRSSPIITSLSSPIYFPAMVVYLVSMWVLIVGLFALHQRQARQARTFGVVALVAAVFGTANMAGNIWFDTFVAPWLARQIPAALEVPRDGTLVIGALFSYVSMTLGWMLIGAACFRAGVIPRPLAACLIPAGVLAFFPLPPYSIVFGAVVLAVGVWLSRHPKQADAPSRNGSGAGLVESVNLEPTRS